MTHHITKIGPEDCREGPWHETRAPVEHDAAHTVRDWEMYNLSRREMVLGFNKSFTRRFTNTKVGLLGFDLFQMSNEIYRHNTNN